MPECARGGGGGGVGEPREAAALLWGGRCVEVCVCVYAHVLVLVCVCVCVVRVCRCGRMWGRGWEGVCACACVTACHAVHV